VKKGRRDSSTEGKKGNLRGRSIPEGPFGGVDRKKTDSSPKKFSRQNGQIFLKEKTSTRPGNPSTPGGKVFFWIKKRLTLTGKKEGERFVPFSRLEKVDDRKGIRTRNSDKPASNVVGILTGYGPAKIREEKKNDAQVKRGKKKIHLPKEEKRHRTENRPKVGIRAQALKKGRRRNPTDESQGDIRSKKGGDAFGRS